MNIAEALTLLAQRDMYARRYLIGIWGFRQRGDGQVVVDIRYAGGATLTYETMAEFRAFLDGLVSRESRAAEELVEVEADAG